MRTFPCFVPSGDDHVAAVVTVPDDRVEGLVVVLAGTGRHNVVGGTLAGLLSVRLAAVGLATVRLDYAGVGDSPGLVLSWTPADVSRAAAAAQAAVRVVSEALGTSRFAGVGTCYGSRVAMHLLEEPTCVGAVCLAPPVLDPVSAAAARRAPGWRRIASTVRSTRALRTALGPVIRLVRARKPARRVLGALAHLDRARVVFLYGRPPQEDHYSRRARESVETAVAALPVAHRERFELRMLETGPLTTFDGLEETEQRTILDVVVPHVRACFAPARTG